MIVVHTYIHGPRLMGCCLVCVQPFLPWEVNVDRAEHGGFVLQLLRNRGPAVVAEAVGFSVCMYEHTAQRGGETVQSLPS